jgi:dTDP-4-dehydrorhamnose reductase
MNYLITGAGGTVGRALTAHLHACGHAVVAWDRHRAAPEDVEAGRAYIETTRPDGIFHLAIPSQGTGRPNEGQLVHIDWPTGLAAHCAERGVRFVYTSTAMVFTDHAPPPFTPDAVPDAVDGYGGDKRRGEVSVLASNPQALVVRLGWQIGSGPGGNNMIDFFVTKMRDEGIIHASRTWLPACSFLEDTAETLAHLAQSDAHGIYHLDANTRWSFAQLAEALNHLHGGTWTVKPNDDFTYDQRLLDDRVHVRPLEERLPHLH